jgi:hypothetical protein
MSELRSMTKRIEEFAKARANEKWGKLLSSIENELRNAWDKGGYTDSNTDELRRTIFKAVRGVDDSLKEKFIKHHEDAYLEKFLSNYKALTEFFEKEVPEEL